MDVFWQQVLDYVQARSSENNRFVVPNELGEFVIGSVTHAQLAGRTADEFSGVVIHKGLYQEIEPTLLFVFVRSLTPTFANEVFVVLETTGARLRASNGHLGPLREIKQWATENADPVVVQSLGIDEPKPMGADEVLTSMVSFVVRHLAKSIDPTQDRPVVAIAETPERFNDTAWFWVDDTGKTAELFAVPQVRNSHRELSDATLDYVLRLSPESIIQRRSAVPELKLVDKDPEHFRAYNSFFNLSGNLKAGQVCPSIRFNDNRTRPVADYSGNVVHLTFGWQRQSVDIESTIKRWSIDEHADRIVFSHTSEIHGAPRFGNSRHVCDVTYAYTLWQARPTIELSVSVEGAARITDIQVTTAVDQLTLGGSFDTIVTGKRGQYETHSVPEGTKAILTKGGVDYISLFEGRVMPGFAVGVHASLRNGDLIKDIGAEGHQPGRYHWVYAHYRLGTLRKGETKTICEDRLLTGGGYYRRPDIYYDLTKHVAARDGDIDPSMSYDIGAELNAVAATILFAKRGLYTSPPSEQRRQELKAWFDRHLDIYLALARPNDSGVEQRVFVRGLSFVILALDCMERAFEGEYRVRLDACVNLLVRLEVPVTGGSEQSLFSTHSADDASPPELDCQGAALLALARAAYYGDTDRRIANAIRRGLRAILMISASGELYDQPALTYQTIVVRKQVNGGREDTGYWNFKLGLALRAFKAIHRVQQLGKLQFDQDTCDYLGQLIDRTEEALQPSMRLEDGALEALTSQRSGETNSETQPWVALGLAPAIEWEILGGPIEVPRVSSTRGFFDKGSPPLHVEWECSEQDAARLLQRISVSWEQLGRSRPHWSVLTADQFLPDQIDKSEQVFFATGEHDRNRLLAAIRRVGRDPKEFKDVFEFGCGLGRITNYLAESFDHVSACDVSREHLELARKRSRDIGRNNIAYLRSSVPSFGMNRPFDLWFSLFVLQHNSPPIIAMILRRALTLLRPGGLAVFQCPTYAPDYRFDIDEYLASAVPESGLEMHFLPQPALFKLVRDTGCSVAEVVEDDIGNLQWISNALVVTKN